ncbi:MAG: hypothetical protein JXB17_08990, partial [Bacteroidales bacterium]|nr:hypothetical protein [Bacteroidales bacterium]
MNNKKPLWEQPWSYRESFLIAFEILLIGFIIEIISKGKGLSPISWPINLIGGLLFLSLILITHIFFRKRCFIKFLSGVPAAISSITIFCFLTLLLGFIPQNAEQTTRFIDIMGLTHLQHSYPFLFSALYLLFILGLTTLRRLSSINLKNTAFFLNHAGLWITLFAFALGSGDLLQLKV